MGQFGDSKKNDNQNTLDVVENIKSHELIMMLKILVSKLAPIYNLEKLVIRKCSQLFAEMATRKLLHPGLHGLLTCDSAPPPIKKYFSFCPFFESEQGHVTCFGHSSISKCEASRCIRLACTLEVALLAAMGTLRTPCEQT